jgi:hypothetical protein
MDVVFEQILGSHETQRPIVSHLVEEYVGMGPLTLTSTSTST